MKFGAHEVMETHEILMGMLNEITHHNLYAKEAKNQQLKEMVIRHRQHAIASYNEIVQYTQGGGSGSYQMILQEPTSAGMQMNYGGQVQYGLRNPAQHTPESNADFSDWEIASAMLICHKNGSRNANMAALECADSNLRMMLLNCSIACANHAYETFLFMNNQGMYQVPTLQEKTTQTYLNSYQPANPGMQAAFTGTGSATMPYTPGAQQGAAGYSPNLPLRQ